ncbi:hypothetical protein CDAR_442891 [Caerostris darwini]|uniref:Uncharacterized protein n=1 Tax=Caerostris darwini TaxID=1538125 RepID=A0AAV4VP19_9ARAC|nr:hypothetical protein CDAR_442891 [Caerostris darwini]
MSSRILMQILLSEKQWAAGIKPLSRMFPDPSLIPPEDLKHTSPSPAFNTQQNKNPFSESGGEQSRREIRTHSPDFRSRNPTGVGPGTRKTKGVTDTDYSGAIWLGATCAFFLALIHSIQQGRQLRVPDKEGRGVNRKKGLILQAALAR